MSVGGVVVHASGGFHREGRQEREGWRWNPRKPEPGGAGAKEFEQEATEETERGFKCSNVEATFSMIRRKFGDSVRSEGELAIRNEVLAMLLCHNLCCLISAMYEMGVNLVFWVDQAQAG